MHAPSRQDRIRTEGRPHAGVPRYLAEFEYRFNRRYDLVAMILRLHMGRRAYHPMPYRFLKLAEAYA